MSKLEDAVKRFLAGSPAPQAEPEGCTHMNMVKVVSPSGEGCQECLEMGDTWVHLRMCATCGHVGCCDSSKNKHATKHYLETGHPIVKSFEVGENWMWCYADELLIVISLTPST